MARTVFITMVGALMVSVASVTFAQKPVSIGDTVSDTFTITAIDYNGRVVTLENKNGLSADVYCGQSVQRFDQLKVGDKVTFRYQESLVSAISQPGATKPEDSSAVTGTTGNLPGGTISQKMTARVTIEAIDPDAPSVTIKTAKGNRMSFKVEDKKNLDGYKPGDQVDITYTRALAISVEPAK